jgi:hypothetical protein
MKSGKGRISVGFGFAAGTLFGALAVFVPFASIGIPGLKAEGPALRRGARVEISSPTAAPESLSWPLAQEADSGRPAPAVRARTKSSWPKAKQKLVHHSELDLQLD